MARGGDILKKIVEKMTVERLERIFLKTNRASYFKDPQSFDISILKSDIL